MASAGLSTAVKLARRSDLSSTAIPHNRTVLQWTGIPRHRCHRVLSTAAKQWKRGIPQWPTDPFYPNTRHDIGDIGYTVDVTDLLFTPDRDFLLKNNGQKIKVDDLRGKTVVLFIVPLDERDKDVTSDALDMIDAYYELLRVGSAVEFVFVPVQLQNAVSVYEGFLSQEALFNHLFNIMPFPAIPFSHVQGPQDPVVQTFSVDELWQCQHVIDMTPYWVVIDPTNKVEATRSFCTSLFKLFGGAELHPLSHHKISALLSGYARQSMVQRISKWDQLLASDTRDFLLSSNGDKVPISSLKGKLVGLYFCENIPHPPRMQAIKKVYEEAKMRGYDFEIVQITFHYHPFNAKHLGTDPTVQQCWEDISWLTLPFKDPSCRKVQRVFNCLDDEYLVGDCLVLIYPCQAEAEADDSRGVLFEFSGAEILERWGIEGYPFTRPSLYKAEYELQQREVRLQTLFPPGEYLLRSAGDGFDPVNVVSQLSGKRVLVLFAPHNVGHRDCVGNFISMLKSEYQAQLEDDVAVERKFEVVYVSTGSNNSSFDEFTKDMPWLVWPFSSKPGWDLSYKVFKGGARKPCAAAFNEQGELIAKDDEIVEKKEGGKLRFPFIDQDFEKQIRREVEELFYVTDSDSDG